MGIGEYIGNMAHGGLSSSKTPLGLTRLIMLLALLTLLSVGTYVFGFRHVGSGSLSVTKDALAPLSADIATSTHRAPIWYSIHPIQYAWYGVGPRQPPVVGPLLGNWKRLPSSRSDGTTVLYIRDSHAPNRVLLLRYKALTAKGLPIGKPAPISCTLQARCWIRSCQHAHRLGQCISIENTELKSWPILVLYVEWLVRGVPLSLIEKYGPATDAASWGLILGSHGV